MTSPESLLVILKERRSVRKYRRRKVAKEVIERLIEFATWAPSAHNSQPWRFVVVEDFNVKVELAEAMAERWMKDLERDGVSVDERIKMREESINRFICSPILVVACITLEEMDKYPDARRQRCEWTMATQSLSAAIQNLLIAAAAYGLGTCWYCAPLFCKEEVRKVLDIPDDVEPQALITVGYPAEKPPAPARFPLSKVVFKDRWGEPL
ncbi:nitroreductase family protein [Candidatus Bathyarchaeota archaeon]|nr:nitroreductase family protein [Candidatus Bathyarchaeota archaeon]